MLVVLVRRFAGQSLYAVLDQAVPPFLDYTIQIQAFSVGSETFDGFPTISGTISSRSVLLVSGLHGGMAKADAGDSDTSRREIRLVEEEGGEWSAIDEETGVASQGETRSEALVNLDEAVALHKGEIGEPVTDADLRDLGIDPDSVPDEPREPDAPWFSE